MKNLTIKDTFSGRANYPVKSIYMDHICDLLSGCISTYQHYKLLNIYTKDNLEITVSNSLTFHRIN